MGFFYRNILSMSLIRICAAILALVSKHVVPA